MEAIAREEKVMTVLGVGVCFWGSPALTVKYKEGEEHLLPKVLEYDGKLYGRTGYNSDGLYACYSVRQYELGFAKVAERIEK
jgi:hypothetical protein